MGVDIAGILEKKAIGLEELKGTRLAVDAYNTIYQFVSAIRQPDGRPLSDSNGRPTSHLIGLLHRNARLLGAGIRPFYVFDGIPSRLKSATLEKRKQVKVRAEEKYREAVQRQDMAKAYSYAMQTTRLTEEMIVESMRMLELLGIPYMTAPADGEAQASQMASRGDVWAVASQDFDSLLYGAPRLVRNLSLSGRRKMPGRREFREVEIEMLELEPNLKRLGISREQLVDIAILVGTDFNEGVKGIGAKKGLAAVKKNGRIESTPYIETLGTDTLSQVRQTFLNAEFVSEYQLAWKKPDEHALVEFLCEEHEFSKENVEETLAQLKNSSVSTQQSLDSWN